MNNNKEGIERREEVKNRVMSILRIEVVIKK